jgi:hypothetical protein
MTSPAWQTWEALVEGLAQYPERLLSDRVACLQAAHTVTGQRHPAQHRHLAPADQPHIGDRMIRGATGPGHDQRRPIAREACDVVDTRGLNGLHQGHGLQDGGEPARQRERRMQGFKSPGYA